MALKWKDDIDNPLCDIKALPSLSVVSPHKTIQCRLNSRNKAIEIHRKYSWFISQHTFSHSWWTRTSTTQQQELRKSPQSVHFKCVFSHSLARQQQSSLIALPPSNTFQQNMELWNSSHELIWISYLFQFSTIKLSTLRTIWNQEFYVCSAFVRRSFQCGIVRFFLPVYDFFDEVFSSKLNIFMDNCRFAERLVYSLLMQISSNLPKRNWECRDVRAILTNEGRELLVEGNGCIKIIKNSTLQIVPVGDVIPRASCLRALIKCMDFFLLSFPFNNTMARLHLTKPPVPRLLSIFTITWHFKSLGASELHTVSHTPTVLQGWIPV